MQQRDAAEPHWLRDHHQVNNIQWRRLTVSKATLGKLLRSGVERIWVFPAHIYHLELNWTELNRRRWPRLAQYWPRSVVTCQVGPFCITARGYYPITVFIFFTELSHSGSRRDRNWLAPRPALDRGRSHWQLSKPPSILNRRALAIIESNLAFDLATLGLTKLTH